MTEQGIISLPKEAVQKLLRKAGLAPAGTQRSSNGVTVSPATCGYCLNKFGPFCLQEGITPFVTPNCMTNLGAGAILIAGGAIPNERTKYLRQPRYNDSSTKLRSVSLGVYDYPCCCCCCSCPTCKERLLEVAGSPNRGKSTLALDPLWYRLRLIRPRVTIALPQKKVS